MHAYVCSFGSSLQLQYLDNSGWSFIVHERVQALALMVSTAVGYVYIGGGTLMQNAQLYTILCLTSCVNCKVEH